MALEDYPFRIEELARANTGCGQRFEKQTPAAWLETQGGRRGPPAACLEVK